MADGTQRGMKVFIGCEESGAVRDAFIRRGCDAMSCDILPTRSHGPHYQGDVFDVIDYPWDIGIFHPPCTHTSVSGARHFAAKWMDGRHAYGPAFFMKLWRRASHIRGVAFEQPVSVMSSLFRKPDQVIHPWMFGHWETKATCLWLRGLPPLEPLYRTANECREALGLPRAASPMIASTRCLGVRTEHASEARHMRESLTRWRRNGGAREAVAA